MVYNRRDFMKSCGLFGGAALLPVSFCCGESKKRPNVVIIFSDEMTPDYLGYYGGNYPTANIDRLAAEGMQLDQAFACAPMCTPSRYGLLTGRYPGRCTHPTFLAENPTDQPCLIGWNTYLHENIQTLPRILSENGYVTGMVGKWHLGDPALDQDEYLAGIDPDVGPNTPGLNSRLQKHQARLQSLVCKQGGFDYARSVTYENNDNFKIKKLAKHNFPWTTKGAVDLLNTFKAREKPFFLYIASTALHGPHHGESLNYDVRNTQGGRVEDVLQYRPDVEKLGEKIKNMSRFESYKTAGLAELDHQIGIVTDKLKELELEENTIVIFMADHGVEPAKASCYQYGVHIPAWIKWPSRIKSGSASNALIQNVDIMPTILDVAGIAPPATTPIDGKSIRPIIEKRKAHVRHHLFVNSGYARSVSDGKYTYLAFRPPDHLVADMKAGRLDYAPNHLAMFKQQHASITAQYYPHYFDQDQLYDLQSDPYERHNLAHEPRYAAVLKRLKAVLAQHLRTFRHPYDLTLIPFMETKRYQELAHHTIDLGTDFIPWWRGRNIEWPPK